MRHGLREQLRSAQEEKPLADPPPLSALSAYYAHLGDLARGYVKNPLERDTQLALIRGWQSEVEQLQAELSTTTLLEHPDHL
jgi:hypothetical protein